MLRNFAMRGVVACILLVGITTSNLAIAGAMVFEDDFEQGKVDFQSKFTASGNAPVISTERSRAGRYSMKSYLNRATSPVSKRTEVSVKAPLTHIGDELWYGFSIFLPKSFVPGNVWEIVTQWHGTPNNGNESLGRLNPPLSLATWKSDVTRGHWSLFCLWDADRVTSPGVYETDGSKLWDLGPWATDEWTDWVFHIKWSYSSDGIMQVWKNGVQVVNYKGPNTYNDDVGPYLKMGVYKGWGDRNSPIDVVTERTLWHDEIRIAGAGGSYEMVAPPGPRIGSAASLSVPKAPASVAVE
jgi:hypothetical protein